MKNLARFREILTVGSFILALAGSTSSCGKLRVDRLGFHMRPDAPIPLVSGTGSIGGSTGTFLGGSTFRVKARAGVPGSSSTPQQSISLKVMSRIHVY